MDRFMSSEDFHLGPSGRTTPQQYISKRTAETPSSSSVPDGALLETSRHNNPCNIIENWTSSNTSSPGAMISCQQPWPIETAPSYSISPSHSPMEAMSEGIPRLFPYDNEWPTSSFASIQLKPSLRRPNKHRGSPPDWTRETDNGAFESDPSSSYSHAGVSHQNQSEGSGTAYPVTTLTPPSPTYTAYKPLQCSRASPPETKPSLDCDEMRISPDTEEEASNDPPYSLLIYQALHAAPGMKLPLQGIYSWFEKNTAKGKDRNSKGWQNSIRHNLSMNAGFEAVREESTPGKKAVNFWRLTDEAVNNGIQSTTRYRKQANYKKALCSDPPAPQRQRSGAKGGKATKITAKFRGHSMGQDDLLRKERCRQRLACQRRPPPSNHHAQHQQKNLYGQYYHHHHHQTPTAAAAVLQFHVPGTAGTTTPLTRPSAEPFDLGSVVGCADPPPCTPIFCDMAGPGPDCPAIDTGFMGWCGFQPFPHGLLTGPEISSDLQLGV